MKKLFIIAAAVVAITACTKKKDEPNRLQEVKFDLAVITPTKAVISGTVLPSDVDFKVYAMANAGDFASWSAGTPYFTETGATVSHLQTADGWHCADQLYYWPEDGKKLSFQAFAPASLANTTITSTGVVVSSFSLGADVTSHTDILYSERVVNKEANDGVLGSGHYGVQIPFHHALAQLAFTARLETPLPLEGDYFTLKGITIKSVRKNGSFNQTLVNTDGAGVIGNPTWTINEEIAAGDYSNIISEGAVNITTTASAEGINPCLIIPQNVTEEQEIWVTFDKKINGVTSTDLTKKLKINTQKFDSVALGQYVGSKKYIFNLIFSTGEIFFDPQIIDWVEVDSDGTNIKIN